MNAVNYSDLRAHLKKTMDTVCENHEPIVITRKNTSNLVLISYEDFSAIEETAYLLRSPKNTQRLLESIASFNQKQGIERTLIETEE